MGDQPERVIEYAQPVPRDRAPVRDSLRAGIVSAAAGVVPWGIVWFRMEYPLVIFAGLFCVFTAPVFCIYSAVRTIQEVAAGGRFSRVGVVLSLLALSLTGWACALLVLMGEM